MSHTIDELITRLRSEDLVIQAYAAEELAQKGPDAKPAAVALVKASQSHDETVREWVVAALESLETPSPNDVDALIELVGSESEQVTYWAITLLGRLGPIAAASVPELVPALSTNPHSHVQQRAAWALGKIGPAAADALPTLAQAANGPDPRLARFALQAQKQIEH